MNPHRSPLHEEHTRLGARMTESGGWSMPLEFAGPFKEYRAHRSASVLWDASDLGSVRVSGAGARDLLQRTLTNDLARCGPGRSQYTLLLSGADGSVLDDLMLWWLENDHFLLTANRPGAVLDALRSARAAGPYPDCRIEDVSAGRALLALQGAQATERMAELAPAAGPVPVSGVSRLRLGDPEGFSAALAFGKDATLLDDRGPVPRRLNLKFAGDAGGAVCHLMAAFVIDRPRPPGFPAGPELSAALIEEGLRLASPVRATLRTAVGPRTVGDVPVPGGARLMVLLGSANRDERVFEEPGTALAGRRPAHLAFGAGPHRCLGRMLAHTELRHVIGALAAAAGRISSVAGARVSANILKAGYEYLPVRVEWR